MTVNTEFILGLIASWLLVGLAAALTFKRVQLRRFPEASNARNVMIGYFLSSTLLGPITWAFAVYRYTRDET